MSDLASLASLEASRAGVSGEPPRRRVRRRRPRLSGRGWLVLWTLAVLWSVASFVPEDAEVLNPRGLPALGAFWAHAVRPDLSAPFLRATLDATLTTVAFGALGTVLAIVIGLALAPVMSQTWWSPASDSRPGRPARAAGLFLIRAAAALPRGVHEAVWGLLLISVLGRDPVVGVLAIAIPFGAVTAKVYSELLDETDREPYALLRAAGAGRAPALLYGLLPNLAPSLISYAFYRFECSIRSAVILGMIGAGGLGLQLSLSFQGLEYGEMWTSIYALVLLGAAVDRWGALLRAARGGRRWKVSAVVGAVLVVGSLRHLDPDLSRWFSTRTFGLLGRLVGDLLPPQLPAGGWPVLLARSVETLQMSVVAVSLAAGLGVAAALLAARGATSPLRRAVGWTARQLLLLTRAIPAPVWALLVLFVVFPGPLPGALALGIYTFGVLGRLFAEVVEDLDPQPREALTVLGAPPHTALAYATVPAAAGQLLAYTLYRWEVTVRETVVVGVVGAGGLGRLLEQQRAGFDYPAMTTTVAALIVVCVLVDLLSLAVRTSIR